MSELLDKQVNVQKESLKKLPGFMQAHKKCVKTTAASKKFVEGTRMKEAEPISVKFRFLILQTMKVLFLANPKGRFTTHNDRAP